MTILVDSREQRPLVFGCNVERKALTVGDYGARFSDTHICEYIFERKSIGDLYSTLTFGYDRFRREIKRAEDKNIKLVIAIEGTREKVLKGYKFSKRDPASILKQLETIRAKYGVEHIFFGNRKWMARGITDFFLLKYEKFIEDSNVQKKHAQYVKLILLLFIQI